jgi:hypothetical protein
LNLKNSVMNSGWIEREMEKMMSNVHFLLQNELDRTVRCLQILEDYYNVKDFHPLTESQDQTIYEIPYPSEVSNLISNKKSFIN